MALYPSNSNNLEQLALEGLKIGMKDAVHVNSCTVFLLKVVWRKTE